MVLLAWYVLLIILNSIYKRNKFLLVIDFVYMWILMGWSYGNADYAMYLRRYMYPETFGTLEPIYIIVEKFFGSLGYDYQIFLIVMSVICLIARFIVIQKISSRPNQVIALYLIYPFIMDIVQIRMFYATTFVLIAILLLREAKKPISFVVVFAIILVATLIHNACIIYMLLPLAKVLKKERISKYSRRIIIGIAVATALLASGLLYSVGLIVARLAGFGQKYVETIVAAGVAYKVTNRLVYMAEIILFFVIVNLICKQARKMILSEKYYYKERAQGILMIDEIDFLEKCNYLLFLILPLAWFSGDIYRVQHGFAIVIFMIVSNVIPISGSTSKNGKLKHNQIKLGFYTIGLAFVFMVLFMLLLPGLRETVFLPAFFNNKLIG